MEKNLLEFPAKNTPKSFCTCSIHHCIKLQRHKCRPRAVMVCFAHLHCENPLDYSLHIHNPDTRKAADSQHPQPPQAAHRKSTEVIHRCGQPVKPLTAWYFHNSMTCQECNSL